MKKIESLIKLAAKGADIPKRVFLAKTGKGAVDIDYLITPNLLIPVIIMITNIKHHQMFGDELITIKGGIICDETVLSGVKIIDDISLADTNYPLGFILISLTSTFVDLKKYIENGLVSDFIKEWKKNTANLKKDTGLKISNYANFKVPRIK